MNLFSCIKNICRLYVFSRNIKATPENTETRIRMKKILNDENFVQKLMELYQVELHNFSSSDTSIYSEDLRNKTLNDDIELSVSSNSHASFDYNLHFNESRSKCPKAEEHNIKSEETYIFEIQKLKGIVKDPTILDTNINLAVNEPLYELPPQLQINDEEIAYHESSYAELFSDEDAVYGKFIINESLLNDDFKLYEDISNDENEIQAKDSFDLSEGKMISYQQRCKLNHINTEISSIIFDVDTFSACVPDLNDTYSSSNYITSSLPYINPVSEIQDQITTGDIEIFDVESENGLLFIQTNEHDHTTTSTIEIIPASTGRIKEDIIVLQNAERINKNHQITVGISTDITYNNNTDVQGGFLVENAHSSKKRKNNVLNDQNQSKKRKKAKECKSLKTKKESNSQICKSTKLSQVKNLQGAKAKKEKYPEELYCFMRREILFAMHNKDKNFVIPKLLKSEFAKPALVLSSHVYLNNSADYESFASKNDIVSNLSSYIQQMNEDNNEFVETESFAINYQTNDEKLHCTFKEIAKSPLKLKIKQTKKEFKKSDHVFDHIKHKKLADQTPKILTKQNPQKVAGKSSDQSFVKTPIDNFELLSNVINAFIKRYDKDQINAFIFESVKTIQINFLQNDFFFKKTKNGSQKYKENYNNLCLIAIMNRFTRMVNYKIKDNKVLFGMNILIRQNSFVLNTWFVKSKDYNTFWNMHQNNFAYIINAVKICILNGDLDYIIFYKIIYKTAKKKTRDDLKCYNLNELIPLLQNIIYNKETDMIIILPALIFIQEIETLKNESFNMVSARNTFIYIALLNIFDFLINIVWSSVFNANNEFPDKLQHKGSQSLKFACFEKGLSYILTYLLYPFIEEETINLFLYNIETHYILCVKSHINNGKVKVCSNTLNYYDFKHLFITKYIFLKPEIFNLITVYYSKTDNVGDSNSVEQFNMLNRYPKHLILNLNTNIRKPYAITLINKYFDHLKTFSLPLSMLFFIYQTLNTHNITSLKIELTAMTDIAYTSKIKDEITANEEVFTNNFIACFKALITIESKLYAFLYNYDSLAMVRSRMFEMTD